MKEILNKYGVYIIVALLVGAAALWWVSNKSDTESKNIPAKSSQVELPQPATQSVVGTVTIADDEVKTINSTETSMSGDRINKVQGEISNEASQPREINEDAVKNKENTLEQ
jgi:flagellar basal body-associated protein FliL